MPTSWLGKVQVQHLRRLNTQPMNNFTLSSLWNSNLENTIILSLQPRRHKSNSCCRESRSGKFPIPPIYLILGGLKDCLEFFRKFIQIVPNYIIIRKMLKSQQTNLVGIFHFLLWTSCLTNFLRVTIFRIWFETLRLSPKLWKTKKD